LTEEIYCIKSACVCVCVCVCGMLQQFVYYHHLTQKWARMVTMLLFYV